MNIIISLYFNKKNKNKSISIYFVDSHMFTGIEKISNTFNIYMNVKISKKNLKKTQNITDYVSFLPSWDEIILTSFLNNRRLK